MPKAAKPTPSDDPSALAPPASFESAVSELEAIVERMEAGELTLEESLAAHKRGLELAQYCQGVLAQAQQQVKVLEDNALKSFSADSGE